MTRLAVSIFMLLAFRVFRILVVKVVKISQAVKSSQGLRVEERFILPVIVVILTLHSSSLLTSRQDKLFQLKAPQLGKDVSKHGLSGLWTSLLEKSAP